MAATVWWDIADPIITLVALVIAALAGWRVGGYCRQCRAVVQACVPIVQQRAELHRDDDLEVTQPHEPIAFEESIPGPCGSCGSTDSDHVCDDPHPTGRHALPPMTQVMPAHGVLEDASETVLDDPDEVAIVRPYVRATAVPRYAFAETPALGDVIKCQQCGQQSRSISKGCSWCGLGTSVGGEVR